MYVARMADKNYFINGVPELLVLRLLSQQEMYGYQLVAAIQASGRRKLFSSARDASTRSCIASRPMGS